MRCACGCADWQKQNEQTSLKFTIKKFGRGNRFYLLLVSSLFGDYLAMLPPRAKPFRVQSMGLCPFSPVLSISNREFQISYLEFAICNPEERARTLQVSFVVTS